jgi:S1-C subfamily serine protease
VTWRSGLVGGAITILATAGCAADPPSAVVGIVVDGCDPGEEIGSGMIVAPGLVLTSAHVLAGASEIVVSGEGGSSVAEIVAFDPEMDLAYLSIDDRRAAPMRIASDHVVDDDAGVAYVVRDRQPVAVPVRVRRRVRIRTEDIYVEGETLRPGFELEADIRAGDSGGAVMVDGDVIGVIWARSNKHEGRAYAIDAVRAGELIREQLRTSRIDNSIDLARCH